MADTRNIQRIPLQLSSQCVMTSIQVDLTQEVLRQFRIDLLGMLHSSGAKGVILDLSGVEIIDGEDWQALRGIMAMAALLGARTIFAGLRPGVVSSLVDLEVDLEGVEAALNLDEALQMVNVPGTEPEDAPQEEEELGQVDEGTL